MTPELLEVPAKNLAVLNGPPKALLLENIHPKAVRALE